MTSIEQRLRALEAMQPPNEPEEVFFDVAKEAEDIYKKCYLACQEATETEEEFNKLFICSVGSALALVSTEKIEREFTSECDRLEEQRRTDYEYMHTIGLEVMDCTEKMLKERGIMI